MDDIHEKVRKALANYFSDNWTSTQVQRPNRTLDTSKIKKYIAPHALAVEDRKPVLGTAAKEGEKHEYFLVFQIFVEAGSGDGVLKSIADDIRDLFDRASVDLEGGGTMEFRTCTSPTPTPSGQPGWYQENMRVPFFVQT